MSTTSNTLTTQPRASGLPKAATPDKVTADKSKPARLQAPLRTVRFEYQDTYAWIVSVVGTFNDWQPMVTPLNSIGCGKWSSELNLPPGRHEYRFLVNGEWRDDPNAKAYVPNPHGDRNAVLVVT